ncbi:hypothetical protein L0222_09410 [bacterium]|nr:hypothetical protein [bacterium]MCI0604395.1 hypothetical protein [bacterium]
MAIPPIPLSPSYREAIKTEPQPVQTKPAVPIDINAPVRVNGKPVSNKDDAAAKASEHKLCGQVQEAKVRSIYESTKDQQNVFINGKQAHRKDDQIKHCGKDNIEEKT